MAFNWKSFSIRISKNDINEIEKNLNDINYKLFDTQQFSDISKDYKSFLEFLLDTKTKVDFYKVNNYCRTHHNGVFTQFTEKCGTVDTRCLSYNGNDHSTVNGTHRGSVDTTRHSGLNSSRLLTYYNVELPYSRTRRATQASHGYEDRTYKPGSGTYGFVYNVDHSYDYPYACGDV